MPHLKDEPLVILKDQSVTSVQNKSIGGMGGWGMGVSLTPKQYPQSSGYGQDECGSDTDNHSCPGPASALPIHPPKHADKAKKNKKQKTKNKNKNKKRPS